MISYFNKFCSFNKILGLGNNKKLEFFLSNKSILYKFLKNYPNKLKNKIFK